MSGSLHYDQAVELMRQALMLTLLLGTPLLLAALASGVVLSLLQSLTGLTDPSISAVPRLAVGAVMVLALLPWVVERLGEYCLELQGTLPGW